MRSHRLLLFASTISIIFGACKPSAPSGILGEKELENVLVDFHLAQGMAETHAEDVSATRYTYLQAVFRKHRITEAEFDSTMVYYSGQSEILTHIYNKVLNRVRVQAERMGMEATSRQDKFANLTSDGDTANIWIGKNYTCLQPTPSGCIYTFRMQADTTFRAGDSFVWRFKSQFVMNNINNEAIALLNLYFDADTVVSVSDLIRNSDKNELRFSPSGKLDSLTLHSIAGHVYLPNNKGENSPKPLLLSNMSLIRMHSERKIAPLPQPADVTLPTDSVTTDTIPDDAHYNAERLTPKQMRESQPRKHTIRVTKENPNPIHPQKGIPQRTKRRYQNMP